MSVAQDQVSRPRQRRRVRNTALGLMALALGFYFGFIALLVHHSHH
ncbi:MAG: hypothetical protein M3N50_10665 [Pseudomonadota bacterium]|nr:hypothetical protein [Pseudomonadota bacterium]